MLGKLYDANGDSELLADRAKCKDLCFRYNQLLPSRIEERQAVLGMLLGRVGKDCLVEQPFYCDYGYNISLGDHFYGNVNCVILDAAPVVFGDHVFIAPNCGFYTAGHPFDVQLRNKGLEYARPIHVGNHVWVGAQVCVLPGVTIGDYSVIGAGSVVNKDVPPCSLAVGNPCKVIRTLSVDEALRPETIYELR